MTVIVMMMIMMMMIITCMISDCQYRLSLLYTKAIQRSLYRCFGSLHLIVICLPIYLTEVCLWELSVKRFSITTTTTTTITTTNTTTTNTTTMLLLLLLVLHSASTKF